MSSVFFEPPDNFTKRVEVSGCFCEFQNQILLLKRHVRKPHGETWGLPAGKFEKGETARAALIREVEEEVGISIPDDDELKRVGELYIRLPHVDYVFYMFYRHFSEKPPINLNLEEHHEAVWITPEDALDFPLIIGGHEAMNQFIQWRKK